MQSADSFTSFPSPIRVHGRFPTPLFPLRPSAGTSFRSPPCPSADSSAARPRTADPTLYVFRGFPFAFIRVHSWFPIPLFPLRPSAGTSFRSPPCPSADAGAARPRTADPTLYVFRGFPFAFIRVHSWFPIPLFPLRPSAGTSFRSPPCPSADAGAARPRTADPTLYVFRGFQLEERSYLTPMRYSHGPRPLAVLSVYTFRGGKAATLEITLTNPAPATRLVDRSRR